MSKTYGLPSIGTYGNYSSGNYGVHTQEVTVGPLTVWFSYQTPVAFQLDGQRQVVRKNDWSTTTGKHLNWIDGGNKKGRISGEEFERQFRDALKQTFDPDPVADPASPWAVGIGA